MKPQNHWVQHSCKTFQISPKLDNMKARHFTWSKGFTARSKLINLNRPSHCQHKTFLACKDIVHS